MSATAATPAQRYVGPRPGLSLAAVGHAASGFILVTYVLCVLFDLAFPSLAMNPVWSRLLPGFQWLDWPSFALGAAESYAYGWYVAVAWVPLYNLATRRQRAGVARTRDSGGR